MDSALMIQSLHGLYIYLHCAKLLGTFDISILIYYATPSRRRLIGAKCILLHDNGLKHDARVIKKYLQLQKEQGVLQQMVRPLRSPDLDVMESVRD